MKYTVEVGSGVTIYMPSFIKTGPDIEELKGGLHRQHGDGISLLLFFQNKESKLNTGHLILSTKLVTGDEGMILLFPTKYF
jgi:hypothetical protein